MKTVTRALPIVISLCLAVARGEVQNGLVRSGGQPIPGAPVTAACGSDKISTVTDETGRFEMGGLPSSSCTFAVAMFGFERLQQDAKASTTPLTFELKMQTRAAAHVETAAPVATAAAPTPAASASVSPAPATPAPATPAPATPAARPGPGRGGVAGTGGRGGPGRGGAAAAQGGGRGGFQNLALVQNGEAATDADPSLLASAADNSGANEALLVNGSISSGVQSQPGDGFGLGDGGFGRGGGFGGPGGPGGFGDQGFGGPGAAGALGQLPGGLEASTNGPGGQGGGPLGAGGGRGGGPAGFGGGRGGPGGPGGGGGPAGFGGGGGGGRGGGGGAGGGGGGGGRGGGGRGGDRGGQAAANGRAQFGNRVNRGRGPQFRLGLNYSLSNSAFNARSYSFNGTQLVKPSSARNQFGVNMGGPLIIPHLFRSTKTNWFLNYSGQRSRTGIDRVSSVPTADQRAGNFSGIPQIIFDPLTNQPFPGNIIPASRIDRAAAGLLSLYPLPNAPGIRNNFQLVATAPQDSDNIQAMINQTITTKDRLALNLNHQSRSSVNVQSFGFRDPSDGSGTSLGLNYSHTFRNTLINTLAFNFSRNVNNAFSFFSNGTDIEGSLGITGVSGFPLNYGPPNLQFTNVAGLSDSLPSQTHAQTAGLTDTLLYRHGKHNVSFGVNFQRRQNNILTDQNGRGTFNFTGIATRQIATDGSTVNTTGYDFADFLLSRPYQTSVTNYLNGNNAFYFRETAINSYVSDDWRYASNLSFTTGLRWEYFGPYTEKNNRLANLIVAPNYTGVTRVTAGRNGTSDGLIEPKYKLFSPRLGVAWKPFKKRQLLIRSGYGIYYTGGVYGSFSERLGLQQPFVQTVNAIGLPSLSLENGFSVLPGQTIQNTFAVDPNYSPAYAQQWNLSLQETFARSYVVSLNYLGIKGTHLDVLQSPNRANPGPAATVQQRLNIPYASTFTYDISAGNSIYNGATLTLNRRMARNRAFTVAYTLSKSIDDASTLGAGVVQNLYNIRGERALSNNDQRHRLNMSFNVQSPVANDRQGHLWDVVRGWTLTSNFTVTSGTPFTATVSGDPSGTGIVGSARAQATGQSITGGTGYFNAGAFKTPDLYTLGSAGRNTIPGITGFTSQASLFRSFRFGDRHQLSFQINATNPLNHVNVTRFGTVIDSINVGLPTSASPMRSINASTRFTF